MEGNDAQATVTTANAGRICPPRQVHIELGFELSSSCKGGAKSEFRVERPEGGRNGPSLGVFESGVGSRSFSRCPDSGRPPGLSAWEACDRPSYVSPRLTGYEGPKAPRPPGGIRTARPTDRLLLLLRHFLAQRKDPGQPRGVKSHGLFVLLVSGSVGCNSVAHRNPTATRTPETKGRQTPWPPGSGFGFRIRGVECGKTWVPDSGFGFRIRGVLDHVQPLMLKAKDTGSGEMRARGPKRRFLLKHFLAPKRPRKGAPRAGSY